MNPSFDVPPPARRSSGHWKIDAVGIILIGLLGLIAWVQTHPFTPYSVVPLCLIGYALWRIVFELTWNRYNVPTLATGFIGRRKVAGALRKAEAESRDRRGEKPFTIIDLGSGRGELSRYLARAVPHSHIIGIEIARVPHMQAQFLQRWLGPANITYMCFDFGPYDCAGADAVVMYLSGNLTATVGEKLRRELRAGAVVIANTFPLRGEWVPSEVMRYRTPFREQLFIYRKS